MLFIYKNKEIIPLYKIRVNQFSRFECNKLEFLKNYGKELISGKATGEGGAICRCYFRVPSWSCVEAPV